MMLMRISSGIVTRRTRCSVSSSCLVTESVLNSRRQQQHNEKSYSNKRTMMPFSAIQNSQRRFANNVSLFQNNDITIQAQLKEFGTFFSWRSYSSNSKDNQGEKNRKQQEDTNYLNAVTSHQNEAKSGRNDNDDDDDIATASLVGEPQDRVEQKAAATTTTTPHTSNQQQQGVDTLRRLVAFAQPEHGLIYASAFTLLITSSVTLILPTASGQVIDMVVMTTNNGSSGGGGPSMISPALVAAGLFGLTAVAGAGVYARTLWLQQAGNTLAARIKQRLYQAILQQELAYLEQIKTGDFMTRLSQDTTLIQSAVTVQAVAALRALVMTTGSTIMLFQTSATLALVSLGTLPPLFLSARHVGQNLREKQRQVQTLQSQASSLAEEALNGIATVKQFGGESQELQRYGKAIQEAHAQAIRTGKTQAFFDAAVHVGANGAVLCVLGYGGSMVLAGTITAGDLTGFLMYSLLLAGNVSSLSGTYAEVMKAVAAADRVWEVIDRQPTIPSILDHYDEKGDTQSTGSSSSLVFDYPLSVEFRNVKFSYPARKEETILGPNFSLTIQPGERLALVGESGSGKSTTAGLLTRLYDIDEDDENSHDGGKGAILIDGKDIRDWDPLELRQRVVGIVSQEPWLMDGTIAENIRYSRPSATDEQVREAAEHANVMSFVNQFPKGLDTKVGARGTQLSGGQKQRVAIARLILKDPPIIILDEATSALDTRSERMVKEAIDSVTQGRTVISIAHRLSTIKGADRIAVLQGGKIVETGTFDELVNANNTGGGAFRALMGRSLV